MTEIPARAVVEVARPADFDEFWAATLRRAGRTPLDPVLTELPVRSTDQVAAYDVRYGSLDGVRVAGWYTRPRGEGPFPGLLLIPGYISEPTIATTWSELGYAVLSVAPRGKLRANDVVDPGYPGLLTCDLADPETYAYRGFYADVVRGFDLLRGLSEVDSERVGVHGSSQGGGLGIVTAALRAGEVACLCAGAPYLCGIMTAPRLTRSYPYHEITEYLVAHPEQAEAAAHTAAYYDGLNFAPKATAPTMVYLGLSDDVCPPETGFAVYEALGAALPARPEPTAVPERSTSDYDFFTVRLTGIGPYRLFGYLSVPAGPGPFPGLLETPRYGSVNHLPHPHDRLRYVVFTLMHRGQRLADTPYGATYPGLLTDGIEDPRSYVYRGVIADCLRGAEFLLSRPELDTTRVAVTGDDLALLTAARRPAFRAARVLHPLLYRATEAAARGADYPQRELADLLRQHPETADAVATTLSFFDPVRHAPSVRAETLLAVGAGLESPEWLAPLLDALADREPYPLTFRDAEDTNGMDAWLATRLGTRPMPRFLPAALS